MGGGSAVGGHNLLEEDVGRDEYQGRAERAEKTDHVGARNVEGACQHYTKGKREQGGIGAERITDSEEEAISCYSEQWREGLPLASART